MTQDQKIAKIKKLLSVMEVAAYELGKAYQTQDASSGVRLQRKIADIRREIEEKLDWL